MNKTEVKKKFSKLEEMLSQKVDERSLQKYLEENAFMVTGFGGHVHKNIVISQLPLGNDFRTDFAWLDGSSAGTTIHLIEIESASLQIFNENGDFSQPYNHAIQQLKDWHHWANRNQQYLVNLLEPLELLENHLRVSCRLIAGRRSCLINSLKKKRRYESLHEELPKWAHTQTWDGFVKTIPFARYAGSHSDYIKCVSYRDQNYFEKNVEDAIYGAQKGFGF